MPEKRYASQGGRPASVLAGVALPVVLLLIVIAVVSGLVVGGVIQGEAVRSGAESSPTTGATIIIEP